MAALQEVLFGNKSADEVYDELFVQRGVVRPDRELGDTRKNRRGFNLTKQMQSLNRTRYVQAKEPTDIRGGEYDDPTEHDDYGVVEVRRDPYAGWRNYLKHQFGTASPFLAELALDGKANIDYDGDTDKAVESVQKSATEARESGAPRNPVERFVEHDLNEKAATGLIDAGVVQSSTPILIDPEVFDTVRRAAPVLEVIDTVAQAGYTASYNLISGRDAVNENSSLGMQAEDDVDDLSGQAGQGMTLQNVDKDMKIFVDLVNISDFSRRAQSTLNFMDLEGTTLQARLNEYATFKAKQIFYGDPSQSQSDGGIEDSAAYEGLRRITDQTSDSTAKSGVSLSGDKALFEDIKGEIVDLVQNQNVTVNDLHILCSPQTFEALENEAHINVRLDAFDEGANFGGMTLSIMNVPITADPNIQQYTLNGDNSSVGDVFIIDTRAVQFRALAPLFTLPLGRLGLADRTAIAEYGRLIDKSFDAGSNTTHTRTLEGYAVP